MANRYPKNPRFSNIIVNNNGNGSIEADKVSASTLIVKNLIVTDSLKVPVSNIDTLDDEDIGTIRVNRQNTRIANNSGHLYLDSNDGNVKIEKSGNMESIVSGSNVIENINTNDYTQYIDNSKNKFTQMYQEIEFKGEQKPETKEFILGSSNNINFTQDDSNYYIFSGNIVANIKKPSSGMLSGTEYITNGESKRLQKYKPKFAAYHIHNGIIRLQESNISNYDIRILNDSVANINFKLVKLQVGNKCYLSIVCDNFTGSYISWFAKIKLYKINVNHNNNSETPFSLNNMPSKDLEHWTGYNKKSSEIYFHYAEHVDFYNIHMHSLSKKNGANIPNTIFCKNTSNRKFITIKDDDEVLMMDNDTYYTDPLSNEVVKFKKNPNKYNYVISNKTLLVIDNLDNNNLNGPYCYKNALYFFKDDDKYEVNRFNSDNKYWKKYIDIRDNKYYINDIFSTLEIDDNKISDYTFLKDKNPFYFDLYQCSIKEVFCIRKPINTEDFLEQTFLNTDNDTHLIMYKAQQIFKAYIKTKIYLNSEKSNYKFQLGSINIITGNLVINQLKGNHNYLYTLEGFFYIPSYQELRADLIDKIINKKISNDNINEYIENTFCNKSYQNVSIKRINNLNNIIPVDDEENKYMDIKRNKNHEDNAYFGIDLCICPDKLNICIDDNDTYDLIGKKLNCLKNLELTISIKNFETSELLVGCFIKNNVFNVFSI